MVIIKEGYGSKKLEIKIAKSDSQKRTAELWIDHESSEIPETLNYITLEELLDLKDEIYEAIQEIIK